jgi:hypothetical protein
MSTVENAFMVMILDEVDGPLKKDWPSPRMG